MNSIMIYPAHLMRRQKPGMALLALFWLSLTASHAQYAITQAAITGGGGTSTGSVYSVTGAIGQAAAGRLSGGTFTVDGGVLGVVTVLQTAGMPPLTLQFTNQVFTIAWAVPQAGYVLEYALDLNGTWVTVPASEFQTNGTQRSLSVTPAGVRFYRLRKLP
ncbi:MAG: hypothetical protein WCO56_28850 [Verrucomicrobiota bacterium]